MLQNIKHFEHIERTLTIDVGLQLTPRRFSRKYSIWANSFRLRRQQNKINHTELSL